ncbi:MAG: hypothetical protein GY737_32295 [Desulfobacteraceae bacterium]|nr:hypothetical protein [Desulfobacteraceae bacterium]
MSIDCTKYPLNPPKVIAIAQDNYLTPKTPFPDVINLQHVSAPKYGQDITSSINRVAPGKYDVGQSENDLKPKMEKLLTVFARGDKSGMAKRLFNAFLNKQSAVTYFDDYSLNLIASNHENINDFCSFALSAPNSPRKSIGKTRIHQALEKSNWDINKIMPTTDLGVPAFNKGSKAFATEDFNNGLGLMINGVQYVYVVARNYHYDKDKNEYCITLKFIFYDVFGLDDEDLKEFGATSDGIFSSEAAVGITAWWQLQHQHDYAPLVTRIIVERTYKVPTK